MELQRVQAQGALPFGPFESSDQLRSGDTSVGEVEAWSSDRVEETDVMKQCGA